MLRCMSRLVACAVKRRRFPVGARPTRQPLQPEATGAVMEVTKWLMEGLEGVDLHSPSPLLRGLSFWVVAGCSDQPVARHRAKIPVASRPTARLPPCRYCCHARECRRYHCHQNRPFPQTQLSGTTPTLAAWTTSNPYSSQIASVPPRARKCRFVLKSSALAAVAGRKPAAAGALRAALFVLLLKNVPGGWLCREVPHH